MLARHLVIRTSNTTSRPHLSLRSLVLASVILTVCSISSPHASFFAFGFVPYASHAFFLLSRLIATLPFPVLLSDSSLLSSLLLLYGFYGLKFNAYGHGHGLVDTY